MSRILFGVLVLGIVALSGMIPQPKLAGHSSFVYLFPKSNSKSLTKKSVLGISISPSPTITPIKKPVIK